MADVPALPQEPVPDEPVEHEWTPNVDLIQFSRGKMQRRIQGVHSETPSYTMTYSNLTLAERNLIYNFIVARNGGESFSYRFHTEANPRLFIAPGGIQETRKVDGFYDLQFTMQEVFDLDIVVYPDVPIPSPGAVILCWDTDTEEDVLIQWDGSGAAERYLEWDV